MGADFVMDLSERLARRAIRSRNAAPLAPLDWKGASPRDVRSAFHILAEHRLHLLLFARLTDQERQYLPADLTSELENTFNKTRNHQGLLELTFAQVTHGLQARGVAPIACKGIVLARDYYRPKGVRPMQDIDLWIPHSSIEVVREVLASVGFRERPEKETNHALYFENSWGLLLDVHHHMALFEMQGFDPFELSIAPPSGWARVFRPEALLIHLVYHLLGHTRQVGILLGWVLDIAVVLNAHEGKIDWKEARRLCPTDRVWKILMRLIALAITLNWIEPEAALENELEDVAPVSFATLVRLRHLAPLGLTSPRGWARLVKRIGVSNGTQPPLPPLSEIPRGLQELFLEGTKFQRPDCALLTGEESNRHEHT